jgi:hypothetical protein
MERIRIIDKRPTADLVDLMMKDWNKDQIMTFNPACGAYMCGTLHTDITRPLHQED